MMPNGARPTELDTRDRSFHQTFGAISKENIEHLPETYDVDAGLTMPDQVGEGNPFSCTAYTTCDLGTDQDKVVYAPEYTYMKTLFMQGLPPETNGSDIRPSLKSASVYGLLPKEHMPESLKGRGEDYTANQSHWATGVDAFAGKLEHRKGGYFNVYIDGGLSWFDSFRSALWINKDDKRAISCGLPWICSYGADGMMQMPDSHTLAMAMRDPFRVSWHNVKISGWTMRHGKKVLRVKAWIPTYTGDKGWLYMTPEVCNALMEVRGSVAYTMKDADPSDIRTIKIGMYETILKYLLMIIGKKLYA